MRQRILAAVILGVLLALPGVAGGVRIGEKNNGYSYCDEHFKLAENEMQAMDIDPGRDLTKTGASDGEVCQKAAALNQAINEIEAELAAQQQAAQAAQVEATTAAAPVTPASGGSCPAEMAGEATSPDAVNPTSGAFGCWQTLPSHYNDGGACSGLSTDQAGQYACVQRLCADGGNAHWDASGATPCG